MEPQHLQNTCQIHCLPNMTEGYAELPTILGTILRFTLRRNLNLTQVRNFKRKSSFVIDWLIKFIRRNNGLVASATDTTTSDLKSGDLVRVLSKEEIDNTLNCWKQVKGCKIMPEMLPYCGTIRRVSKRIERFVDEHDYQLKKCQGIVFLEGLVCQGTEHYGRCDRTCPYFWREEWLEKVDEQSVFSAKDSSTTLASARSQAVESVRVCTQVEIESTLDDSRSLKGCTFMPEMLKYCGTIHRVSKRLDRFLDERDYHVKKCQGVVLLEGIVCQGSEYYGRCDRACHYFWREEWLKTIDDKDLEEVAE